MLFDKAQIGGIVAKCRIVRSATFEGLADAKGIPQNTCCKITKNWRTAVAVSLLQA